MGIPTIFTSLCKIIAVVLGLANQTQTLIILLAGDSCFDFNSVQTGKGEVKCRKYADFYGIVISIFHKDHNPPHFHARYGNYKIAIEISNFSVISGYFPPRALGIVMEWAALHKDKLLENWEAAEQEKPLFKIEPLK